MEEECWLSVLKWKPRFLRKQSVELTKFYLISEASFLPPPEMSQTAGDTQHCMVFSQSCQYFQRHNSCPPSSAELYKYFQFMCSRSYCPTTQCAMKAQNWSWNKNTHYLPQWLLPQLSHIPLPWQQSHLCVLFSPFLPHTPLPPFCCFWLILCRQILVTFEKPHYPVCYL